jgi:hypothetical protein
MAGFAVALCLGAAPTSPLAPSSQPSPIPTQFTGSPASLSTTVPPPAAARSESAPTNSPSPALAVDLRDPNIPADYDATFTRWLQVTTPNARHPMSPFQDYPPLPLGYVLGYWDVIGERVILCPPIETWRPHMCLDPYGAAESPWGEVALADVRLGTSPNFPPILQSTGPHPAVR